MNKKIGSILGAAATVISIFLIVGVKFIFPACGVHDDGTYSSCHSAGQIIWWMAIAIAVIQVVCIIVDKKAVKIILQAVSAVVSIVCALIPGVIVRLCMMPTMRCQASMKPWVMVCSIVLAVLSIIGGIAAWKGSSTDAK